MCAPLSRDAVEVMTVNEIRDWLTSAGHEQEVWGYANRKPPPKKPEWVDLMCSKLSAMAV